MADNLSAEQVRETKIASMGPELGELHYALYNEVAWLHMKWNDFRALFGTSPERIEFLNRVAPAFFHDLQATLFEDALLHLCRLTDPPESVGRPNLSIRRLSGLVSDIGLRTRLESLTQEVVEKTRFARDWRNRRLAHKELPSLNGEPVKPLAEASRQHVEEALAAIREAMNCVELHYQKSPVMFEHSIAHLGGVGSLLHYLEKGLEAQDLEHKAMLARLITPTTDG